MGIDFSIDITAGQRKDILALLERHLPDTKAWAYGSRVSWTSRPQSDIDMVVFATPEQKRAVSDLREAFEESSLPFRVDLFVWDDVPGSFRKQIERDHVVLAGTGRSSSTFRTAILGEVTKLTLSSVDKKTKSGEFTVLLCNYMDVYSRRFIRADIPFMTATATRKEIERCRLQADDVVITKDSEKHDDIGVPTLVRENIKGLVCGYHLAILRPSKDELHGPYLYYVLQTGEARQQFHSFANGVTRFGLRKDDILRVKVPLPPLPEQQAIADILGALDDKIELNRRMNETLEAMARAIFKDWFVDFGPVRAKMEGRAPYLSPEIWKLFPDSLDEEGKPSGWEERSLLSFLDIVSGGTPKTRVAEYWGGKIPWFSVIDAPTNGGMYVHSTEKNISEKGLAESSAKLIHEGTTIITARGTVGKIVMAARDMTFNQSCYALRAQGPVGDRFVYLVAVLMVHRLQVMAHGSVFPTITRTTFNNLNFPWVGEHLFEIFEEILQPIFSKIKANGVEIEILALIRDLLLPKLMSGEIRLRDAEKEGEAVA